MTTALSTTAFRNRQSSVFARLKRFLSQKYYAAYKNSLERREEYWANAAEDVTWFKKWNQVIDNSNPPFTKWFVGGEYSHCYNAIDRHVLNGKGQQTAIIHDSPVTNSITTLTYSELHEQVSRLAGALSELGVQKSDRVLIYMPMIPQVIVAMMATVRLGAVHVVVFGGFSAKELSVRIESSKPKVIICASYGIEPKRLVEYKPMVDQAIEMSHHKPLKTIVYQRPNLDPVNIDEKEDADWDEIIDKAPHHDCVPVPSNHPLYLLYTSGTTGLPKAVVRPTAGHSVVLQWSMKNVYGVQPGEVFWTAADIGWAAAHSYGCHAPLLSGNPTILYEGKPVGTPDSSSFFRVVQTHKPVTIFTAPTALRAIKQVDPEAKLAKKYDLSSLRTVFVGGEHCDSDTANWSAKAFNAALMNHWWQTESGHPMTAPCLGLDTPLYPPAGTTGLPVPGWDIKIVDSNGIRVKPGKLGNIVAKLPLNLGSFQTLWEDEERFVETYFKKFPGYYDTMDAGIESEDGFISVLSRTDDVINVAGHRLSCGHIEEVICSHHAVVEAAVVAKNDEVKGSTPFAFVILKADCSDEHESILQEITNLVREQIGPVAAFKEALFVNKLPKTRAGKIPRRSLQNLLNGIPYQIPSTIDDEAVYPELEGLLLTFIFRSARGKK